MTQYVLKNTTGGQIALPTGGTVPPGGSTAPLALSANEVAAANADGLTVIPVGQVIVGQVKIVTTGTPQQLPNIALQNGVALNSKTGNNAAGIGVGAGSGINNTYDGGTTGNAFVLAPGMSTPDTIPASNANQIYVVGTAGDIIGFIGS